MSDLYIYRQLIVAGRGARIGFDVDTGVGIVAKTKQKNKSKLTSASNYWSVGDCFHFVLSGWYFTPAELYTMFRRFNKNAHNVKGTLPPLKIFYKPTQTIQ